MEGHSALKVGGGSSNPVMYYMCYLLGRKILDDLSSSAETTLSKGGDPLSSAAAATLQAQAQQVRVYLK